MIRPACIALILAACAARPPPVTPLREEDAYERLERVDPYVPYATRLASFRTKLGGPLPDREPIDHAPEGATEIHYSSDVGSLRAWYARPPSEESRNLPVVVFLHNDFGLKSLAWQNARAFLDAGFAILVPGLRGEDDGPGERELLAGEVRDAKAAIAWARAHRGHDANCVSVIGHSIGGGIAALLALHADTGVRLSASVGGMYRAHTFQAWARRENIRGIVRFDPNDAQETQMRLLLPNVRDLARPHIAYAGEEDEWDMRYAALVAERARAAGKVVEHVPVHGDHMGSIAAAVNDFIARLRADPHCSQ